MVMVVGSGLSGSLLAIRLDQLNIKTKLFDVVDVFHEKPRDGRTLAVTYDSKQFLDQCGIWADIENYAEPINYIRVFENGSAWTIDYDAKEIGENPMGYIVEYDPLRDALLKALKKTTNVEIFAPCSIERIEQNSDCAILHTKQFGVIKDNLLIGADGRNSLVRNSINVKTKTKEYGHKALVAHFTHEKPHNNTAWEVFDKIGPFAMLPMKNTIDGKYQSGIVWCGYKNTEWEYFSDFEIERKLEEIFPYYGKVKINSKRWIFSLIGATVDKITDTRVALVGDAAHVLHPVAGQGINLGWRDVKVIANMVHDFSSCGLDFGSQVFLDSYEKKRKLDNKSLFLFTNLITKIFEIDSQILSFCRQTGFALINNFKPLKKFFMKKAISGLD